MIFTLTLIVFVLGYSLGYRHGANRPVKVEIRRGRK